MIHSTRVRTKNIIRFCWWWWWKQEVGKLFPTFPFLASLVFSQTSSIQPALGKRKKKGMTTTRICREHSIHTCSHHISSSARWQFLWVFFQDKKAYLSIQEDMGLVGRSVGSSHFASPLTPLFYLYIYLSIRWNFIFISSFPPVPASITKKMDEKCCKILSECCCSFLFLQSAFSLPFSG